MSDLQTAFYIIAIIFMSLMLLIGLVSAIAILVIRAKIVAIHKHVEERLSTAQEWAEKGEAVLGAIKKVARKPKR
jgi:Na+-transporting methylmalonyl-CoA/oxaloacetate decarboxylase gamma subunit